MLDLSAERLVMSSAGHPPPLVVAPDGSDADRGLERIPAGTPLVCAFGIERAAENRAQLEGIMTHWETGGAVLHVEVEDVPGGLRYEFSCGNEQLILLVNSGS